MLTVSRAIPLIAIAAVLVLLTWVYGRRLVRWLRYLLSYPAYGSAPLCPHCLFPLPGPHTHLCPSCTLPFTGFAGTDPILRIASVGALYRRGSERLVGFGLAGILVLVALPCIDACLSFLDDDSAYARAALIPALPWFLVLFKNFLTRRQRHAQSRRVA